MQSCLYQNGQVPTMVVRKDAQRAKQVGIFGLLNIQLTLIKALVKEFL
jgi:hypothetical protein